MSKPPARQWVRAAVDYGGPAVFLIAYLLTRDMIAASWALVGGSALALLVGFLFERRIAPMPLMAGGAALVFGLLTVIFHDETFVKIKPTVLNLGFAAALLGGLALGKNPLRALLGEAIRMPDATWRTLTLRYSLFFMLVAFANELVWRTQPDAVWVLFRVPGLQILALAFSFTQVPLMMKGMKAAEDEAAARPD